MISGILAWIADSRFGRWVAGVIGGVGIIAILMFSAFRKGEKEQADKEAKASLDNLRARGKTNEEVSTMSDAELNGSLAQWMRRKR
jgi:hypothetical protein